MRKVSRPRQDEREAVKTNRELRHGLEHLLLIDARELVHSTFDEKALEALHPLLGERHEVILHSNTHISSTPLPPRSAARSCRLEPEWHSPHCPG